MLSAGTERSAPPEMLRVQADREDRLEAVLGAHPELYRGVRSLSALDLADAAGDHVRQVVVLGHPHPGDQVVRTGHGEDLADAVQRGDRLGDLGDAVHAGLDEHDRGDHGWLSPSVAAAWGFTLAPRRNR